MEIHLCIPYILTIFHYTIHIIYNTCYTVIDIHTHISTHIQNILKRKSDTYNCVLLYSIHNMRCFSYKFSFFGPLVQVILYPFKCYIHNSHKIWHGICIYISYFSYYYFVLVLVFYFIPFFSFSILLFLSPLHTHISIHMQSHSFIVTSKKK